MRACRTALCFALVFSVACGDDDGGSSPNVDAGNDAAIPIDGSEPCAEDSECNDGVFCNGIEFCDDTQCKRGAPIDCDDGIDCTTDVCSDATSSCRYFKPDFDNDGHPDALCEDNQGATGDDCDDENANRFPGNIEVCDAENVDEDCNPTTFGNKDQDKDGATDRACCNRNDSDVLVCGTDCDDLKSSVNPSASEVCDLFDNDCDGMEDEAGAVMLFPDADFDGHGEKNATAVPQCAGTPGFATVDDDCNDDDPAVHAAQVEICDTKDNDCDRRVDESPRAVFWYSDKDGDKFGGRLEAAVFSCAPVPEHDLRDTDCDDENAAVNPGAAELCDGLDNNCDVKKTARIGINNFEDDDNDGSADAMCGVAGDDCDDNNGATGGNLLEICDKVDNDCDDLVDEDVADTVWYVDADGDGYGDERLPAVVFCAPLAGRSAYPGDCNDADANVNPVAFEVCSLDALVTADENCNGQIDEGFCPVCGDGVAEGPEQCDERAVNSTGACADPDGVCNSDTDVDACRTDCRQARCGDGVTDTGEGCDTGDDNSADPDAACRLDCLPRRCGDGIVDVASGEACDDNTPFCLSDCTAATWSDGICAPVTTNLATAVGTNVVAGDTTGGSTMLTIDGSGVPGMCSFTGAAPNGPERIYTWQSPASMLYAFAPSNAGTASRLTLGLFFNDARFPTSCTEPWACLEPAASSALVARVPNGEGTAIAIDSAGGQAFNLSIYPLVCCPEGTDPSASGACFTATSQAQLTCALAAVPGSCLGDWDATCVATADAACSYTCP